MGFYFKMLPLIQCVNCCFLQSKSYTNFFNLILIKWSWLAAVTLYCFFFYWKYIFFYISTILSLSHVTWRLGFLAFKLFSKVSKCLRKDSCRSGHTRVLSQYFTAAWCLNTLPVLFRQEGHACWRKATAPAIVKLSCLPLKSRWSRQIINICMVTGPFAHPLRNIPPSPLSESLIPNPIKKKIYICSHSKRRGERVDSEGHRPNKFWKQILFPLQPVSCCCPLPFSCVSIQPRLKAELAAALKVSGSGVISGSCGADISLSVCIWQGQPSPWLLGLRSLSRYHQSVLGNWNYNVKSWRTAGILHPPWHFSFLMTVPLRLLFSFMFHFLSLSLALII